MAGDVSFGTSPACADPRSLYSGPTQLIAAFVAPKGILIVQQDRIRLVDRAGNELGSVLAERPFSTAAFDGSWLAVADNAIVSAYSVDLEPKGSIGLVEACASSVMVSGQRFVCGSASDTDRVFYVYDLVQQALLAQSSNYYTYNGIPMRRVGGRDFFITVNVDMTADYHLYRVDALSNLAYYGDTSYFDAFTVTREYAFTGKPADHLVTPQGIMLNIFTATCTSTGLGSGCMAKDGNLGTLWPQQIFVALINDDVGDIYGLVGVQKATSTTTILCAGDCLAQHIDPVQRVVVSQRGFGPTVKSIVTTQHDPYCDMLLVGYVGATSDYNLDLVAY
jgi:hypothetical protein